VSFSYSERPVTSPLPSEDLLKNLFHAVVLAQDSGLAVPASREHVAKASGRTVDDVRLAERRGLDHRWFPLG
jgi:hypothetical protein